MSFIVRDAKEREYEEILDLTAAAFAPRAGRDYFHNAWQNDVNFRPDLHRVGVLDGRIVAAVRIADRTMRVGCAVVNLGGIADVATHPDYRGRGYATTCLEDAIGFMEGNDYDLSMLFTGIHAFYRRLGWEVMPTWSETYEIANLLPATAETRFVIEPLEAKHIDGIGRVYDTFNHNRTGAICRSSYGATLWRQNHPEGFLVVLQEGTVVAYVRGALEECANVFEYGTCERAPTEGLLLGFREFVRRARVRGYPNLTITAAMPLPANEFGLFDIGGEWLSGILDVREKTGMMLRIVDFRRLMTRSLPEWEQRIAGLDNWQHVAIEVMGARVGVDWDGKRAVLTAGSDTLGTLTLTPQTFLRALLHGDGVPGYLSTPWSNCLSSHHSVPFHWWPVDNF